MLSLIVSGIGRKPIVLAFSLRRERFRPLEVSDVAYFYSENKITFAVTYTGQEHIVDLSLNKLVEQLDQICSSELIDKSIALRESY